MGEEGRDVAGPLFETKRKSGRIWYRLYASSGFVGLLLIWFYRATHLPGAEEEGRWAWIGMFAAELWFGFYWILTQSARWNPTYRLTYKERLLHRYGDKLPGVDIFVCTADPILEPPTMVINTVLSLLAYDYPPEKLSVYLSDDGGSILSFYALVEASQFARSWIPFCKKFKVESRSPDIYFSQSPEQMDGPRPTTREWIEMKTLYKEMEGRINKAVKVGGISEEISRQHKGFSQWDATANSRNHQAILQILIDGREEKEDGEGCPLPTLVYMAREKRPQHPHNFKAGAMNALLRVSSEITNGPVILNVDCDMYSNNPETVKDALCFFMEEEKGHEFGYVLFPQYFNNNTKNDLYANSLRIIREVDFHGLDGLGGPMYTGSGCFHRREALCGKMYTTADKAELRGNKPQIAEASAYHLEERAKGLATCTYEENSQWGKEMGLKYGCPVEDVITGLSIQCKGWKSVYHNPQRKSFVGVAPMTLSQVLIQQKRWSEGDFQIFLSRYCPFVYGHGRIKLGLQMCYSMYCLWAPSSLPTLYYVVIPPLCLLNGISLFPSISSLWFMPFAFVIGTKYLCSLVESLWYGETLQGWWNEQRMWFFKRTTSYLFAFTDSVMQLLGINNLSFVISAKVADQEVSKRYEKELIEFGSSSPMFTILATIAMLNLLCLAGGAIRLMDGEGRAIDSFFLQFFICGCVVLIDMPIYHALFFRNDSGRLPLSTAFTSVLLVALAYVLNVVVF